jgi:hypothetical protein
MGFECVSKGCLQPYDGTMNRICLFTYPRIMRGVFFAVVAMDVRIRGKLCRGEERRRKKRSTVVPEYVSIWTKVSENKMWVVY